MPQKIEISHRTIIFTVVFLILVWFLYFIRDIILVFFISLLIMAVLNPTISKLSKYKIPRGISVVLVYLLILAVISFSVASIIPPLIEQTTVLANNLPDYISASGVSRVVSDDVVKELLSQFGSIPTQVVKVGVNLFSNVLSILTVFIIAFYLLMSREKFSSQIQAIVGSDRSKFFVGFMTNLEKRLGGWARGQITLMIIVGVLTFVGLILLGIPFALPLSLIAGLFEIIPNLGPIVSAVPAVIIGFSLSPVLGLATIALFVLIQQVENYLFVPKIMEKSVGVTPVATLLALLVGFKLAGIVGALISVPVFITLQVLIKEYMATK